MTTCTTSSKQAAACGVLVVGASWSEVAVTGSRSHRSVLTNIPFVVSL